MLPLYQLRKCTESGSLSPSAYLKVTISQEVQRYYRRITWSESRVSRHGLPPSLITWYQVFSCHSGASRLSHQANQTEKPLWLLPNA